MGGEGTTSSMIHSIKMNRSLQTAKSNYREKLEEYNNNISIEGEFNKEKYPEISKVEKQRIKQQVREQIRKQVLYSYVKTLVLLIIIIVVIYLIVYFKRN